jgi:phosphonopyruvate decarboxylase
MIRPDYFYDLLKQNGTDFFTGVPDSLLKSFCAYITDHTPDNRHIIAANEGCATGLAAGYHFATGKIPLIYMQNSGLGNTVNPLMSLMDPDVYSVPAVLVIGWRGEPGVHDEPQHVKQGKVTCALLDAIQIPYVIMAEDEQELTAQVETCYRYIRTHTAPYAFVVRKNTFDSYTLKNDSPVDGDLTREEAIDHIILSAGGKTVFVSTTGMASRELFELRVRHGMDHRHDFLTVGSMGHASQIALSIAIQKPDRKVYCLDGDGAAIMHMGGMATIGSIHPANLVHVVLNNGAHDSVGGQPTVGRKIDLCGIATSCGYENVYAVTSAAALEKALESANREHELAFIEIKVRKGARSDLGRPTSTPQENKKVLMEFLND